MNNGEVPSMPHDDYFRQLETHFAALDKLSHQGIDLIRQLDSGEASRALILLEAATHKNRKLMDGLKLMLQARNVICSAALVRMQFDNCMRLYAPLLVAEEDREECLIAILNQKKNLAQVAVEVNGKKKKLRDGFLKDALDKRVSGTKKIYDTLSGYIHLSGTAFWDSYSRSDEESQKFSIGGEASEVFNPVLLRFAEWFCESTRLQHKMTREYVALLPASEAALFEEQEHDQSGEGGSE